jgi:hypothetical protein
LTKKEPLKGQTSLFVKKVCDKYNFAILDHNNYCYVVERKFTMLEICNQKKRTLFSTCHRSESGLEYECDEQEIIEKPFLEMVPALLRAIEVYEKIVDEFQGLK